MTDEQKQMLEELSAKQASRTATFENILHQAASNVQGRKHKAMYATALQLFRSRGEHAATLYLAQKGIK